MANEKETLEIKKKPQQVNGEDLKKVNGGDGGYYCDSNGQDCTCHMRHWY